MFWSLITTLILSLCIPSFAAPSSTTSTSTSTSTSNSTTTTSSCVVFDSQWNLLAFGFNNKDYNAGTQDTWGSANATPTDITKSGRPPFDSSSTTCYLAQFFNAIYVLNADKANPSSIYIYDVSKSTWSTQKTTPGQFDPLNFAAILDHDTNVFYAYSKAELFSLDMSSLKTAQSSPISWVDVQQPDLAAYATNQAVQVPGANTAGYQPVMALAKNHIHFLGIPGYNKGTAKIFVIHFSFMQPTPQTYNPASFPTAHGTAVSIFQPDGKGVQTEFAFIPDDLSGTYVVNVVSNSTKALPAPSKVASLAASTDSIVVLGSDGVVRSLAYDPSVTTPGGTWQTVSKLPKIDISTAILPVSNGANASSSSNTTSSQSSGTPKGINPRFITWGVLFGSTFALIGSVL